MNIDTKIIITLDEDEKAAFITVGNVIHQYCSKYNCACCPHRKEFGKCQIKYFNNIKKTFLPDEMET